jgi:iron(II)-dependent oxidoreductase
VEGGLTVGLADLEMISNSIFRRRYPWGDEWDKTKCNTIELGLGATTPVGIFPNGASPYGCLDMAGNVWEWTISLWGKSYGSPEFKYPYNPTDGREDLKAGNDLLRVLRGGSFNDFRDHARCASRDWFNPDGENYLIGFRVVVCVE